MITIKTLKLPEDLVLPVSLEIETFQEYDVHVTNMDETFAEDVLEDYVEQSIQKEMQAGEILQRAYQIQKGNGYYSLDAVLECHEMIARRIAAKWNYEDEIHD